MRPAAAAQRLVPAPGQVVRSYRIDRLLGEGGMAFVFAATRAVGHEKVALKVLAPDLAADPEIVARFEREAHAFAKLASPHVVRLLDVDVTEAGLPFLVMELLEGHDLEAERTARPRLPVGEAVDYVLQACAAMIEAHAAGIVHRDLKPANMFLSTAAGAAPVVKVLDFGISKIAGAAKLTAAGAVIGTVLYMSPEQIRASSDVDERTDIWSLGVILYELIAGRAPFEGTSQEIAAAILRDTPPDIRTLVPVPEGVARALHGMLERDVDRRTRTVRDVIRALGPFAWPRSRGAKIAEELGRTPDGGKPTLPVTIPLVKGTVPMVRGAAVPQAPPSSDRVLRPALGSEPAVPDWRPTSERPTSRAGILLGAVLGFTGAMGIALVAAWWWLTHQAGPPKAIDEARGPSGGSSTASTVDGGAGPAASASDGPRAF